MSQFDFGNLVSPLSGTAFIDSNMEPWRDALYSMHSGSSRPSYAVAGLMWRDTTGTPWIIKMFDGTDDIVIGYVDATGNTFTPAGVTQWYGTSGGTANALTLTPTVAPGAYATGLPVEFLVNATNTAAAPTVNISTLGAKTIKCSVGGAKVNLPVGGLQSGMIARMVYDGTDFLLLNLRPYNKSASIASASTLNLDTANGDFVHITGTTTVTAITLAEGRQVVCVADGAFTLTDGTGSSPQGIIIPGAANVTTAAGDIFVARGEGGGTVRIVSYMKASGLPLVSAGGGAWEVVTSTTLGAGSRAINFTDLASGYDYQIKVHHATFNNGSVQSDTFGVRLSSNNGSSWISSQTEGTVTGTNSNGTSTTVYNLSGEYGQAQIAGLERIGGIFDFFDPMGGDRPLVHGECVGVSTSSSDFVERSSFGWGDPNNAASINAIGLYTLNYNFAVGTKVTLLRQKRS